MARRAMFFDVACRLTDDGRSIRVGLHRDKQFMDLRYFGPDEWTAARRYAINVFMAVNAWPDWAPVCSVRDGWVVQLVPAGAQRGSHAH